jgi:uncharacterized protein (TIGR00255 family)
MTYSMTGYGKHSSTYNGRVLTVEIRTLNSKQADMNVRMPSIYREKEFEIRDTLSNELIRGKIDLSIQRDLAPGESGTELNEGLVGHYYDLIKKLETSYVEEGATSATDYMNLIMKMPEITSPASESLEADEYLVLRNSIENCLSSCMAFREQEGAKLVDVLRASVESILTGLEGVGPMEADRIANIRGRISNNLKEDQGENAQIDRDRFEQELIYYLEKLDITEEKVRLKAHCDFFLATLSEHGSKGKKLSFIGQEMGREINTLGSKAQHSEMQRLVVGMKDELEKIKEQVLNVL